ncbi:MAG: cytochrome c3 family protein [Desulfobacter sp.]|nr:cytochrome c3 family protein [Desulfobacter sp.]WDP88071.1 MAG: cytochrome c3 family protein [Desulfobacter sp.]
MNRENKMKLQSLIIVFILLTLGAWGAMASDNGEESRMDVSAFENPQRPAALFDHDTHNENAELEDCAICHHVWENGQVVEDESSEDSPCSECHGLVPGPENAMSLSNAFHTQCRTCHIDTGKGPLLCGQCHKKQ